ncbi:MAG TPA: hypothetical protein PLK75_03145 [Bacteroidales bacterium]|nr:hypothetical protein [Bacteroidales bacterium]
MNLFAIRFHNTLYLIEKGSPGVSLDAAFKYYERYASKTTF